MEGWNFILFGGADTPGVRCTSVVNLKGGYFFLVVHHIVKWNVETNWIKIFFKNDEGVKQPLRSASDVFVIFLRATMEKESIIARVFWSLLADTRPRKQIVFLLYFVASKLIINENKNKSMVGWAVMSSYLLLLATFIGGTEAAARMATASGRPGQVSTGFWYDVDGNETPSPPSKLSYAVGPSSPVAVGPACAATSQHLISARRSAGSDGHRSSGVWPLRFRSQRSARPVPANTQMITVAAGGGCSIADGDAGSEHEDFCATRVIRALISADLSMAPMSSVVMVPIALLLLVFCKKRFAF